MIKIFIKMMIIDQDGPYDESNQAAAHQSASSPSELGFSLGKVLPPSGEADQAWEHFILSNQIK